jgi:hypothetical protein
MVGINGEEWDIEKICGLRREGLEVCGEAQEADRFEVGY